VLQRSNLGQDRPTYHNQQLGEDMAPKPKKPAAGDAIEATIAEATDTAATGFRAAAESLESPNWPGFPTMSLEEIADFSRDNLAAMTKSNMALTEGLQAISEEIMGYARTAMTSASQTATALLGARTFDEVVQLNTELAKSSIETLLARSAKLSEMGVSVASETMAPLEGRIEATFAKLTHAAA
jgi:phasin family protein